MNESKAARYQRKRRRAAALGTLAAGSLLIVLAGSPAGARLANWAVGLTLGWPVPLGSAVSLLAYVASAALLWQVFAWPLARYRNEKSHGAHGFAMATAAAFAGGAAVQAATAFAGPWWWAIAGAGAAIALMAALHLAPGFVARTAKARAVERPALVERLGALARQVRVPIASIDELPAEAAPTATALVTGAGSSRRVFIAADLLRDWTEEEIAVVVAHEMAHHVHHDLWRTVALDALVITAGLWASDAALSAWGPAVGRAGPADLASLPFIAAVVGAVWLVSAPLRNAQSRRQERRADAFALSLTGSVDAFSAAIRRLSARHLAEERPSPVTRWLYHRHPPVAERLAMAEAFRRAR